MNALKSYVDMKFDVLKGMMDKTLARSAEGAGEELGEDDDLMGDDGKDIEAQLEQSMAKMAQ